MHDTKHVTLPFEIKADSAGAVRAAFVQFGVVDKDRDVIMPEAFPWGKSVKMVGSHEWGSPVIGAGALRRDGKWGLFDGRFYLGMPSAQEWYESAKEQKADGLDQEWSFGFQILEAEPGVVDGQPVRIIKRVDIFEVSPVLVGAGVGTHTVSLKGEGLDYDTHAAQTLGAVEEFVERTRSGSDLRVKRGRPISEARRVRMAAVRDGLRGHADEVDAMLLETADPDAPKSYTEPDGGSPEAKNAPAPDAMLVAIREAHARRMARYGVDEHGLIR